MKKLNRRGVSAIIANLLILSIVAVLGTTIFALTVTGYGNYQTQVGQYLSNRADMVSEYAIIEHAWFTDTDSNELYDQATLYIRNTGETALNIEAIDIDGSAGNETAPTLPLSLGLDQVSELNVTLSSEVASGTLLYVEAVTGEGNVFSAYFEVG